MRAAPLMAPVLALAILSPGLSVGPRPSASVTPVAPVTPVASSVPGFSPAGWADPPPSWLTLEAALPVPPLPPETEAVILLDEQSTVARPKGVLSTTGRRAIRVLRPGGAAAAGRLVRAAAFDTKVKSMTGWAIGPDGRTRQATMKQVISSSLAPDTLYMDAKVLLLAIPEVDAGTVVGFEWREERTPPSVEDVFPFQGPYPVLRARYSLTMPRGWEPDFSWTNWPAVEPRPDPKAPGALVFELRDVPAVADEPCAPEDRAVAGRLNVRIKGTGDGGARSFGSWSDMGAWYAEMSRPRRLPDGLVAQKARELAASSPDALSRIGALADFAQREIRYVSIQIGIGGFQPHMASSILFNRYGDCKDKATLLAAMLQAIGVESYYIIIHTDRGGVTPESPVSLYSFNHAILAVRLPDDVPEGPFDALVRHPRLGRLLVFDPTMPTTPLGRLPYYLQDNTGLLVADGGGELLRLPRAAPDGNVLDRRGRLALAADGTLSGEIVETRRGAEADVLRYRMQAATDSERRKHLETFLAGSFASFSLQGFEFRNLEDPRADLVVSYRFAAPAYAKRAGGYLVVRPRLVGVRAVDLTSADKAPRRYPIDLETTLLARDEFTIEVPPGVSVDSLAKPADLDAGFAVYSSRTEAAERGFVYRREYRLLEPRLPVSRHAAAQAFFQAVAADEQQSLLLKSNGTGGFDVP